MRFFFFFFQVSLKAKRVFKIEMKSYIWIVGVRRMPTIKNRKITIFGSLTWAIDWVVD